MSVDTPPPEPERVPALRREALLPNERSRGLGTVAVVCTMAGVASGLALATTLMAMQVADSMSVRACPYRVVSMPTPSVEMRPEHAFLGVRYVFHDGAAEIDSVVPNTPAEAVDLHPGDRVVSIDGVALHSGNEFQQRIWSSHPGSQPMLTVERGDGTTETVHPTLIAWPPSASFSY
jgi:S1-C subfamily serine protease